MTSNEVNSNKDVVKLIEQIRKGSESSFEILMSQFEPFLKRFIKIRFRNPEIRKRLDSTDILQSVFRRFFSALCKGRYDVNTEVELKKLLSRMVQNKIRDEHRRASTSKKTLDFYQEKSLLDSRSDHTESLANKDLANFIESGLDEGELAIVNLRRDGYSWSQIAEELGEHPDTLRKRFTKLCDRISSEVSDSMD